MKSKLPLKRVFGYFLHEQKVTRVRAGEAREVPNRMAPIRKKNFSPPPARRYALQPCIGQMRWHSATKIGGCGGGAPAKKHHSLFRMIFPLMVLGSSSRNTTMRGYL